MSETPVIHWFRRDLRLQDNTALQAALDSGQPVVPLFVFDPAILKSPRHSVPRLAFMLRALDSLDQTLRGYGAHLLIRHGHPVAVIRDVAAQTGADALYFNRDYTPYARLRDRQVSAEAGIPGHAYDDAAILPPQAVLKDNDEPYTVYSPYLRKWKTIHKQAETGFRPGRFHNLNGIEGQAVPGLRDLGFEATFAVPQADEHTAAKRLGDFLRGPVYGYSESRNRLAADPFNIDAPPTSCLSPYLRLGMLSPRAAYWAAREAYDVAPGSAERKSVETWVQELAWRDFYMQIMYHFPYVDGASFRPEYDSLEWHNDVGLLQAWKDGMTGYPVVDAAMRQLRAVGWMPNRARMIVASFLTKDLLVDWREGEQHFMQWLIDGDPASNNGGWQWSAGTGTDAQPYFRVFNPVSQSMKFDPDGDYIRHWVPELRDISGKGIHAPWEMAQPPREYPPPVVDHAQARERALKVYGAVKS
jgi:deoxyribodipyrimidine photo-lyase